MNKYIVKNCPAIFKHHLGHWNCANGIECQYRTDCLIKQVIEKCKDIFQNGWYVERKLPNEILQLFEIEECE